MANGPRTSLVLDAHGMALGQRRLEHAIHPSDQGSPDTSIAFGKRCRQAGVFQSLDKTWQERVAKGAWIGHR